MRTCEKNKIKLWYVNLSGFEDEVDEQGNYTGYQIASYSSPTEVRLPIYPYSGNVVLDLFGKDADLDMVTVAIGMPFNEDTLFFKEQPKTTDYSKTFDYSVKQLKCSLNQTVYGLVKRP